MTKEDIMQYTFPVPTENKELDERGIEPQHMRISDEIERFFQSYSPKTMIAYRTDLHDFWKFSGKPFQNTKEDDILRFVDYLEKKGYKNSTINRKIAALSKIMSIYVSKGLMNYHPIQNLTALGKLYKPVEPSVSINITKHDVEAVVSNSNKRISVMVQCLANTGMRVSEALNVKKEDLEPYDTSWMRVKITHAKNGKIRFCFISYQMYQAIREAYDTDSLYLFSAKSGNQLSRTNVYKMIKRVFQKYTGKECSPHKLRHFFATQKIVNEKKDYKAVSTYLGHANVSTTLSIYTTSHLSPEETEII